MLAFRVDRFVLVGILAAGAGACSSSTEIAGGEPGGVALDGPRYPGQGFVVHEWGTDTVVVGSDGALLRGLHHEEEDLPAFVYDRIEAGALEGSTSVEVKMETPVAYFYSDVARTVKVAVDFPQGVLTQWYPAAAAFWPPIAAPMSTPSVHTYSDPALDADFGFTSQACAEKFGIIGNGLLDWGSIEVMARGNGEPAGLEEAPLDRFTWSHARDVDANPLRVQGVPGAMEAPQVEKFLFYRGLGNFDLPVEITAHGGARVSLRNTYGEAIGRVFVLHVGDGKGSFAAHEGGIAAKGALDVVVPSLDGAPETAAYVDALAAEVTEALDATGLYHDEAVSMVNTWKRQWFGTEGVRLLYLAPRSWTDASIPLSVSPAPDAMVRVMMIRVEVLTPEVEAGDVAQATLLDDGAEATAAETYFRSLGRFGEPRLRRALALLGDPAYGAPLLASLATAETRVGMGE